MGKNDVQRLTWAGTRTANWPRMERHSRNKIENLRCSPGSKFVTHTIVLMTDSPTFTVCRRVCVQRYELSGSIIELGTYRLTESVIFHVECDSCSWDRMIEKQAELKDERKQKEERCRSRKTPATLWLEDEKRKENPRCTHIAKGPEPRALAI